MHYFISINKFNYASIEVVIDFIIYFRYKYCLGDYVDCRQAFSPISPLSLPFQSIDLRPFMFTSSMPSTTTSCVFYSSTNMVKFVLFYFVYFLTIEKIVYIIIIPHALYLNFMKFGGFLN